MHGSYKLFYYKPDYSRYPIQILYKLFQLLELQVLVVGKQVVDLQWSIREALKKIVLKGPSMGLGADSLSVEEKGIFARDEFVSEVRKDD